MFRADLSEFAEFATASVEWNPADPNRGNRVCHTPTKGIPDHLYNELVAYFNQNFSKIKQLC